MISVSSEGIVANVTCLKILLVDDDAVTLGTLRELLEALGHRVALAATGHEALRAVGDTPDVIVCDLGLPDIDGFEIAARLRANARTAPIPLVAMTGYRRVAGAAASAAGFDAWVVKPVQIEILLEAIATAVNRRGPSA